MTQTSTRNKIASKISTLLKDDFSDHVELSKVIEQGIFDSFQEQIEKNTETGKVSPRTSRLLYYSRARQIYNLLNKKSYVYKDDCKQFTNEELNNICYLHFMSFRPNKWKEFERDIEILNERFDSQNKNVQTTDQFECPSCHKRECTYTEAQTRSADEPMTIFVQCQNCGKEFRR